MRLHQAPVSAEGSVGALGRAAPPTPPSCVKLPRRQPALGLSPASRVSSHSRPQQLSSSVVVAAAATRGREASTSTGESHASSLSPEAAKEGMQWLAKWVSSQYMGMGKSAEDAMPELRRRGVVCSDASNGQILFRVPGHQEPLDGPSVIRLLNLKARPGIKQAEPKPPQSLVRSASPSNASSEAPSPSNGGSPRGTSPSREYQVGRLPDSPDATAMRWLAEWIAANYSGLGKQAEDVLPELRRRGVVYSSIKDGRVKFRAPGVTSRIEAPQIVQMLRLQPRPGMRPSEPEPPQSLISMLSSDNRQDASPMTSRASSPSSSRSSSPSRYSSPGKTRAASSLSPEAAMLGMRWLAIFVSSQYLGMGRSAEDALPELRAMGVVCSSVRDGRPMFIMPGHPEEVDAQDVVKLLRLELRPGVRPRAPTPPPALKGNGASTSMSSEALDTPAPPSGKDMPAPPSGKPAASVEDGIKYLAAWVSQNYSGMGKTVEDVLPELRRQGVVCSSVVGTTPLYRMRGQQEMDAGSVIKALRLQARPGVDPSKPTPPPGLELGKPPGPRTPTPPSSPQRAATSTPKPPAAKAQAQPGAAAPSAGKKEATQEAPPSPSGGPKKGFVSDMSESATGQLVLPATVTLLVAAALGGGSVAIKEISKSGFFNPDRLNQQERGLPDGVPQSGSYNITGGPPYSPVKPRESMMLQAPPVGGQQNPPGVQPLDSDRGALLRAQEQEQRRVEREEMERVQREREAREQMRLQMEQQDRELRAQNMRIQEEQARLDREARASEQRQQQERARMEQQEREQREREQREQERRDREQREREQKERAQKEKEDRERAQKEERERAQKEREQKEREQREQREREVREKEERAKAEREQKEREAREKEERAKAEREQKEREAREKEERAKAEREQKEKEQREQEQKEREQKEREQKESEQREREQKEREQREKEQREREQKEREMKEKEQREREQQEREQKEREQKEKEQKEREQREREQKEKEQREREQREREQKEREMKEKEQKEREQREREQKEKEQKEREQTEKEQREREQKEREQREKEQKEREMKEKEQREREQKEREQKEKEQREREQKEREVKEKEQKEREMIEKERKEREERAQREQAARAQAEQQVGGAGGGGGGATRQQQQQPQPQQQQGAPAPPGQQPSQADQLELQQMRMESESMMSPPEQPKGLLGSQKPSGVQPLPGRQTQPLQPPNQARGAESRGGVQPKASADSPSAAEAPQGVKPLSEAGKQENRAPEGPYEPPNQPKGVLPSETPTSAGKGGEDNTDVMPPSMATMMPEDPKQAAMKDSKDKWGSRTNVEKISGGEGDREEAKQAPTLPNPSRAGGLTQDQVEGYEDCLFRSIGC